MIMTDTPPTHNTGLNPLPSIIFVIVNDCIQPTSLFPFLQLPTILNPPSPPPNKHESY